MWNVIIIREEKYENRQILYVSISQWTIIMSKKKTENKRQKNPVLFACVKK